MRAAAVLATLCATTTTAWACPPPEPDPIGPMWLASIAIGVTLLSLFGGLIALGLQDDRRLPEVAIDRLGVDRLARRVRRLWLAICLVFVIPAIAADSFAARTLSFGMLGPLGFALKAHVAVRRANREDVCILADEQHVVLYGPGTARIWIRATPQQLAACAMPRATVR